MKILLMLLLLVPQLAIAEKIYIKVGNASVKKSMFALPAFQFSGSTVSSPNYVRVGSELYKTLQNDLDTSYFFDFVDRKAFLEDPATTALRPKPSAPNGFLFSNWRSIGTEFLYRAAYNIKSNKIEVEAYLYHVPKGETLVARKYTGDVGSEDEIAHTMANDIIFRLTGRKGVFKTKLVFSSDRDAVCPKKTPNCTKWKEIYVSDYNVKNVTRITRQRTISISPAWAPDGKSILYTSYAYHPKTKRRNPDLFSYELDTKKSFLISWRKGVNSGAAFTPDGDNIFLTITKGGNADIYRTDKDGQKLRNITNGPLGALNVEPAISPDGKSIAFSSDRHGNPMIYVMDINGKNVKRITKAGKYNSTPSWSPDGENIVFAGFDNGHFDLFLVSKDGVNLKRLTKARKTNGKWANNEDPSFSPDGRHIVFVSDRSGKKQLYMISPDGKNERRLTFDNDNYFKPKWSYMME